MSPPLSVTVLLPTGEGLVASHLESDRSLTRWPHISEPELRLLWEMHAPDFIRLDDVETDLPKIRDRFLEWLDSKGIDLGESRTGAARRRVRLMGVGLVRRGEIAETQVSMALNDETSEASRSGPAVPDEILRMSAQSTLDAVQGLIPSMTFGLELAFTVEPARTDRESLAVVLVRDAEKVNARYVGACPVSSSSSEAAAKATLQAINRRAEAAVELAKT
jgi:hypothetical protein